MVGLLEGCAAAGSLGFMETYHLALGGTVAVVVAKSLSVATTVLSS
jgi:hypothetical protein